MSKNAATAFAAKTHGLVIGISRYAEPGLSRDYLSTQAKRLASALTDSALLGIPEANVRELYDEDASCAAITSALEELLQGAGDSDYVLIYFAGHGARAENGGQWLLPHDVRLDDIAGTSLDADSLAQRLVSSNARGITVLLDCCHGTGVAEAISRLLMLPPGADFRGLLSASRTEEESYVFPGRGTLFTGALLRVLEGGVTLGAPPGAVHFDELREHLQNQVAEDLELVGHRDAQHVVAAGWSVGGDQLLFTVARVAGANIQLAPQRYTAEYVRRRILSFATIAVGLALFLVASVYVVADGQQYVAVRSGHVALMNGFARFNIPGFPRLVVESDLPSDAVDPASDLARSGFVSGAPFQRIPPSALDEQLKPSWKVLWGALRGDRSAVDRALPAIENQDPNAYPAALYELLGYSVDIPNLGRLLFEYAGQSSDQAHRIPELRAWTRLYPRTAIVDRNAFNQVSIPPGPVPADELLSTMPFPTCADIDKAARTEPMQVLAAATRSGCRLPISVLRQINLTATMLGRFANRTTHYEEAFEAYVWSTRLNTVDPNIAKATPDGYLRFALKFPAPVGFDNSAVYKAVFEQIRVLARAQPVNTTDNFKLSADELRACLRNEQPQTVKLCLRYIGVNHLVGFKDDLFRIAGDHDSAIASLSRWAISMIAPPSAEESALFASTRYIPDVFSSQAVTHSRWAILKLTLNDLGSMTPSVVARTLGHTEFSDAAMRRIREAARNSVTALAGNVILAMHGNAGEVAAGLTAPDFATRNVFSQYASYNVVLPDALLQAQTIGGNREWPLVTLRKASFEIGVRRELDRRVAALPRFARTAYADAFKRAELGVTPGLDEHLWDIAVGDAGPEVFTGANWDAEAPW